LQEPRNTKINLLCQNPSSAFEVSAIAKKPPDPKPAKAGKARPPKTPEPSDYITIEQGAELALKAFQDLKFDRAFAWAMKVLAVDPKNSSMQHLAYRCAGMLDDGEALFEVLSMLYRKAALIERKEYLVLGEMALAFKLFDLADEVFRIALGELSTGPLRLKGRLSKEMQRRAQQGLYLAEMMQRENIDFDLDQPPAYLPLAPKRGGRPRLTVPLPALPDIPPIPAPKPASSRKPPAAKLKKTPPGKKPVKKTVPEKKAKTAGKRPATPRREPAEEAALSSPPAAVTEPLPELEVMFRTDPGPVLTAIQDGRQSEIEAVDLALMAYRLSFRTSYDQLICLPTLADVRSLWYQEETARKVMKTLRGRAILADEVGLGKTIEAGLILKEYLLRGLVRTALILTPSNLVNQWRAELEGKFGIACVSTHDDMFKQDPEQFWQEPVILASLQTVRTRRHFDKAISRTYDLVVVDEAHHLKNRATQNWKLVNAIQKTFLLMLTATPVQNSLEELYNLVTLLRPGHLKTQKAFKAEFVTRGNPSDPRNREKLRGLLQEVMVRNTRSTTQLHLPPRFALTVRLNPTAPEKAFYDGISSFVSRKAALPQTSGADKLTWRKLLEAAGSSHLAALKLLERLRDRNPKDREEGEGKREEGSQAGEDTSHLNALLALGQRIRQSAKVQKVVELLKATPDQKIIFVNYLASLDYLAQVFQEQQIPHVIYQGSMTPAQKQASLRAFGDGCQVLLATGTGGEGHNLQFCHMLLNYDLPWNPMEIEQRIGRLHRIGQEREVQVYNFCAAGSIEDHILHVLDRKINMFELVVGEIDMILGRLQGEEEFSDLVYDLWVRHPDESARQEAFEALAAQLQRARRDYEKSKEFDDKLFQEDFGV